MPVEIKVGPPVLTINQGTIFMVTDECGEIAAGSEHGIFAADTRLVSHYKLYLNGVPWTLLTSAVVRYYSARIGEGLIYDLRVKLFDHVQRMPIAFFTRTQTGALQFVYRPATGFKGVDRYSLRVCGMDLAGDARSSRITSRSKSRVLRRFRRPASSSISTRWCAPISR